jgi:hypothetical protein
LPSSDQVPSGLVVGVEIEAGSAQERHRQRGASDARARGGSTPAPLAAEGFWNDRDDARRGSQNLTSSEPTAVRSVELG